MDGTKSGSESMWLLIVADVTRQRRVLRLAREMTGEDVVVPLAGLFAARGATSALGRVPPAPQDYLTRTRICPCIPSLPQLLRNVTLLAWTASFTLVHPLNP